MSNLNMKRLALLIIVLNLCSCTRPVDHPISANCTWTEDDSRSLDLSKWSDRRHLRFDANTAEDVAIRWADKNFHLLPEWDARQNECMETLLSGVASQHRIDVATVRQYSRDRDAVVDSVVLLSFGVVYVAIAYIAVGRIRRRFPPREPGFWLMTLTIGIGMSLVAVATAGLWSIVIEEFRMGSGHLSYRMNYIPARQHWVVLLVCNLIVFLVLVALIRFRANKRIDDEEVLWPVGGPRLINKT